MSQGCRERIYILDIIFWKYSQCSKWSASKCASCPDDISSNNRFSCVQLYINVSKNNIEIKIHLCFLLLKTVESCISPYLPHCNYNRFIKIFSKHFCTQKLNWLISLYFRQMAEYSVPIIAFYQMTMAAFYIYVMYQWSHLKVLRHSCSIFWK